MLHLIFYGAKTKNSNFVLSLCMNNCFGVNDRCLVMFSIELVVDQLIVGETHYCNNSSWFESFGQPYHCNPVSSDWILVGI